MAKTSAILRAYRQLLAQLQKLQTEKLPELQHRLHIAKKELLDAGEFTKEELELSAEFLARDVRSATEYAHRTGRELKDWLQFDLELAEHHLWEALCHVADPTQVQQMVFQHDLAHGFNYQSGEITGMGCLHCDACGAVHHFYEPTVIPTCHQCGATEFHRAQDA